MAKMEMPDAETPAEDAMQGDSFSEQIAKLSEKDKKLVEDLVACITEKK
jgi:predicted CopG family antitoxin